MWSSNFQLQSEIKTVYVETIWQNKEYEQGNRKKNKKNEIIKVKESEAKKYTAGQKKKQIQKDEA